MSVMFGHFMPFPLSTGVPPSRDDRLLLPAFSSVTFGENFFQVASMNTSSSAQHVFENGVKT